MKCKHVRISELIEFLHNIHAKHGDIRAFKIYELKADESTGLFFMNSHCSTFFNLGYIPQAEN